jgi:hypothetical protein
MSGIAEFVLQLHKMSSIQYRSSLTGKDGPGGGFEPTTSANLYLMAVIN